jgi:hypothetical protein
MADKKDYTSLLGRSSGASWGDIAGAYLSGSKKKDNRARNVLLATLFFNAKESRMQSKVMKNLKENNQQKTFENAGITNRWNAYNKLMEEDEAYKANPNFFRMQSEKQFAVNNVNFPTGNKLLQSEIDFRNKEVSELEEALKNIHFEKIKTGNITKRLSKEEFYKPFEDYYKGRQEEISAPANVSLVHKAWDKITNREDKKILTDMQKEQRLNEATRGSFGYLLNPDEITGDSAIAQYKPTEMLVSKGEAASQILSTIQNESMAKNLITNLKQDTYSRRDLQDFITLTLVDFNPYVEKYNRAFEAYDARNYPEGNKPKKGEKNYPDYIERRNNFADIATGLGNETTNKIKSDMYMLKDLRQNPEKNTDIIKALENRIESYTRSDKDKVLFNVVASSISDAENRVTVDKEIENGKFKDLNDYALTLTKELRSVYNITD